MKRYFSSIDSNVTNTTTTTLTDGYNLIIPKVLTRFLFYGENNDSFVILPPVHGESDMVTNVPPIFIRTLEEAESLLLSDEAKLFLNSFANEIQMTIIEYHMLYCPHTPLYGFEFQNIYF